MAKAASALRIFPTQKATRKPTRAVEIRVMLLLEWSEIFLKNRFRVCCCTPHCCNLQTQMREIVNRCRQTPKLRKRKLKMGGEENCRQSAARPAPRLLTVLQREVNFTSWCKCMMLSLSYVVSLFSLDQAWAEEVREIDPFYSLSL